MTKYFKIGKLAASTGLKGELVLEHSLGKKSDLKSLKAIFLEEKSDNFLPWFLQSAAVRSGTETVVKLEGIDTVEQARRMTPKFVWLQEEDFNKFRNADAPLSYLGFDLVDGDTNLGEIIEVIEQPHQTLCAIMYKGKEALVPVHKDNLKNVDKKHKKVFVTIPEGLLEIYV